MEQHQTAESEVTPALTVDTHNIAAWIGLGHKRFQNMLAGGELPGFPDPVPLPGRRRWFRSHIQEWLAGLEEAARQGTQPQPVRPGRKRGRPRQVEQLRRQQAAQASTSTHQK
jgi:hypothetical protein